MKLNYNVTGSDRKRLVQAISILTDSKAKYLAVPTCAYQVGDYNIDKNGLLTGPDNQKLEEELSSLHAFEAQDREYQETKNQETTEEPDSLVIELPKEPFSEASLENLQKLIESKEVLIKTALGVQNLSLEVTKDRIRFPWFTLPITPDEIKAYSTFITALAKLAREQQRVTAKPKKVENEKYAFRCFLLRLGFIGDEYKAERKILLSKLTGSSAFKDSDAKEVK
jgi:hypothetical protein